MSSEFDFPMGVDVIVRLHDPNRLLEFDTALFSLLNQTFKPIHTIVVTQAFGVEATAAVKAVIEAFDWTDHGHYAPSLINVDAPAGVDIRAQLLNAGIGSARTRFLAFLDGDDYLYGHAYEFLIEQALGSGSALAFGNIDSRHVRVFDQFVYSSKTEKGAFVGDSLADLLKATFCPIHSFVVDRNQVLPSDLKFNPDLNRLEDYDFLLRLCSKYPARFESRETIIGIYNWHLDGRGSIDFARGDTALDAENKRAWNDAHRRVWGLKTALRSQYLLPPGEPAGAEIPSQCPIAPAADPGPD